MYPFPDHFHFRSWKDCFRLALTPVFWILVTSLALHIATYPTQVRTEQRVENMKQEFRQWWEYGGKTMLTIQGINPDDPQEYQKRLQSWIDQYTDKQFRYQIHLVPNHVEPSHFFTAWLLQPGWASLLLFVWFFFYAGTWLEERWGRLRFLAVFISASALGTAFTYIVAEALFHKYLDTPFTGTSFGMAVSMGALAACHGKRAVPFRVPGRKAPFFHMPVYLFIAIWFLADSLINWNINPGIFSAVIPVNFLLLPLGAFLGIRLPVRTRSEKEIKREKLQASLERTVDIAQQQRTEHRTFLAEGFAAASRREFQAATENLTRGLNGLLHETPADDITVDHAVERMVNPDLLIDISANQWLEWGNQLSKQGLHLSSILCLERNLGMETDPRYARMALLLNGAQRLKYDIDRDKGRQLLQKVIELKNDDLHARRAADMLAKYPANPPISL